MLGLASFTEWLFQNGAELRNIWPSGIGYYTALQAASAKGHVTIVRYLLDNNFALANETSEHSTVGLENPLQAAACHGHLRIVQLLVANGAEIVRPYKKNGMGPPLFLAADARHLDVVQYLLEKGADVNQAAQPGNRTALLAACRKSDVEMVQILLDWGADVNLESKNGTALKCACANSHPEVVSMLLKRGADVNVEAKPLENDALQSACCSRDAKSIVRMLLDKGANVNAKPGVNGTALQCAISNGHGIPTADVVKWLLDEGADVNARGADVPYSLKMHLYGNPFHPYASAMTTPVQLAVGTESERLVRLLLEYGADVNAPEGRYGTALQIARDKGNQGIIELLLQHGARDIPTSESK